MEKDNIRFTFMRNYRHYKRFPSASPCYTVPKLLQLLLVKRRTSTSCTRIRWSCSSRKKWDSWSKQSRSKKRRRPKRKRSRSRRLSCSTRPFLLWEESRQRTDIWRKNYCGNRRELARDMGAQIIFCILCSCEFCVSTPVHIIYSGHRQQRPYVFVACSEKKGVTFYEWCANVALWSQKPSSEINRIIMPISSRFLHLLLWFCARI